MLNKKYILLSSMLLTILISTPALFIKRGYLSSGLQVIPVEFAEMEISSMVHPGCIKNKIRELKWFTLVL